MTSPFRERAKLCVPWHASTNPTRYWVGIFYHDLSPEAELNSGHFLWIKAHSKITVQTIRSQYTSKRLVDIHLKLEDEIPADDVPVSQLNHWGDRVIIFRAVENRTGAFSSAEQETSTVDSIAPAFPGSEALATSPSAPPLSGSLQRGEQLESTGIQERSSTPLPDSAQHAPNSYTAPSWTPLNANEQTLSSLPQSDLAHPTQGQQNEPATVPSPIQIRHSLELRPSPSRQRSTTADPFITSTTADPFNISTTADPFNTIATPEPFKTSTTADPFNLSMGVDPLQTTTMPGPSTAHVQHESPKTVENAHLQELLKKNSNHSVETLEAGLRNGLRLLDDLAAPLSSHSSSNLDASHWIQQISNLKTQSRNTKTVVGVVGDTGAGKSSVINALLDEESLVPTNCMRACTAVVTEISYNESTENFNKYRAEIEFITPEDWAKELGVLFSDLLDQGGKVSRESTQQDSEASIAYAKIKAVYPDKTKDELATIAQLGWERLLRDPPVRSVLGTTKGIEASACENFYARLQRYVDSQEKPTKAKSQEVRKEKKQMEYWPLIKVVRIFVKAPVLSTGAVIVDLPGVHDSNAARAAICKDYMKQCNALWIIAPIIRAVNNKAAQDLLGESFRRQLKYDGSYGNITFICSKTDDISTTEAFYEFNLDQTMSVVHDRMTELEVQIHSAKKELEEYKKTQQDYADTVESIEDDIEAWEVCQTKLMDGQRAYAPLANDHKRKRSDRSPKKSRRTSKRARTEDDSDDEMSDDDVAKSSDFGTSTSGSDHEEEHGDPVTEAQVNENLSELRGMKKEARKQRQEIDKQATQARQNVKELVKEKRKHDSDLRAACIAARNRSSKSAVQRDFASGIKELDQVNAEEEDPENWDPEGPDIRDYDKVAQSLPVYCISSRAYQKLSGRLKRDSELPGFTDIDETEVPQLRAHCIKLTEASRIEGCRTTLNSLSQLLNSLRLWSSNAGDGIEISYADRQAEGKILDRRLQSLYAALFQCADDCIGRVKNLMEENIFGRFDMAIETAVRHAVPTAERWGQKPDPDNPQAGGYVWSTYKAVCRRSGVFQNKTGKHDWNDELANPMMKALMSGWEKAFQQRLPHTLNEFVKAAYKIILNFHAQTVEQLRKSSRGQAAIGTLTQQLQSYGTSFHSVANQLISAISEQQKDVNRQFIPMITSALESAYECCVQESGKGSFGRMKDLMEQYVDDHKDQMFFDATSAVKQQLNIVCGNTEQQLKDGVKNVFLSLSRDYSQIVKGSIVAAGSAQSRGELKLKDRISSIIDNSGQGWKEVLGHSENASLPVASPDDVVNSSERHRAEQLGGYSHSPRANTLNDRSEQLQQGNTPNRSIADATAWPVQQQKHFEEGNEPVEGPYNSVSEQSDIGDIGMDLNDEFWADDTLVNEEPNSGNQSNNGFEGKAPVLGEGSRVDGSDSARLIS
ncbi:MAG: hypothetical protein M1821_006924 [Bathelium mastoideum]|nr:MAG: hypothetical protein M1821_006924 [Bathelium mastoideum]